VVNTGVRGCGFAPKGKTRWMIIEDAFNRETRLVSTFFTTPIEAKDEHAALYEITARSRTD
jgi:hypothetical protein